MADSILIIGGGITGIQAALDAANAGVKVVLVEKEGTIGGKMAVLDKNFPTLDCSICIEAPKMSDVVLHQNIEVLTLAEVTRVEGHAGDFTVTIHQKPRFVTSECTRCNDCVAVCPVILKNEFDVGMAVRKAIYTPIEQAAPGPYIIDVENCLNEPPNYLPCNRCIDACAPKCIDFNMKAQDVTYKVGAIIVSAGFNLLNPQVLPEYGYGTHPDIMTSMEFERLLQASGPSGGEIIKPSDGKHPESLLFVLCVGSRDQRFAKYCSRICCMYSLKEAYQSLDHGIKNVTLLYMDIRAYGKGFDEFYQRTRDEGATLLRGRPASIKANGDGKGIHVRFENTETGRIEERDFDLVVLAPAVLPPTHSDQLSETLGVPLDRDGFFKTPEQAGDLSLTQRDGVYLAGSVTGPKDIPDSVTEASAAVGYALGHVRDKSWPVEFQVIPIDTSGEPRVGVFVCHCGSNIAGVVDVKEVVKYAQTLPGVVYAEDERFSCSGSSQHRIGEVIKEKKINRVVVAACSPKTHGATFQGVCSRSGLNPYLLEMSNIRNQDSWVHRSEREAATRKAKEMVAMAAAKARLLQPLKAVKFPVTPRALIVGGGIAGMAAASQLAAQGFETHLVEREPELGGMLRYVDKIAPNEMPAQELLDYWNERTARTGVHVHTSTQVESVSGFVGNFNVHLTDNSDIDVGAIILATGALPYEPTEFNYGLDQRVVSSLQLESLAYAIPPERVTFVSCIGSRNKERGCSRYCCQSMIRQALDLRKKGSKVRVLYKDLRTFSRYAEEKYEEACRQGVLFFQYNQDQQPEEAIKFDDGRVTFFDELTGQEVAIPTDLLVLNIGEVPNKEDGVAKLLKVSKDEHGFLLESHPKLGPVDTAVAGVFLAGSSQGPKNVREAVAQGLAVAAKAACILARSEIEKEPITAVVDLEKCTYCARCIPVCPYNAIRGELKKSLEIVEAMCMGCGTCVAECMVDAISLRGFTDEQILTQVDAALQDDPASKVIVYACNWCSYAGADQAGIAKIQYPSSARIIRVMCSGRISQKLVLYPLQKGAGAVLVTGCHPGDCHYINANLQTMKRVEHWKRVVKSRGIDPARLELWWVSAAEGRRFAQKVSEMHQLVQRMKVSCPISTEAKPGVAQT